MPRRLLPLNGRGGRLHQQRAVYERLTAARHLDPQPVAGFADHPDLLPGLQKAHLPVPGAGAASDVASCPRMHHAGFARSAVGNLLVLPVAAEVMAAGAVQRPVDGTSSGRDLVRRVVLGVPHARTAPPASNALATSTLPVPPPRIATWSGTSPLRYLRSGSAAALISSSAV